MEVVPQGNPPMQVVPQGNPPMEAVPPGSYPAQVVQIGNQPTAAASPGIMSAEKWVPHKEKVIFFYGSISRILIPNF